MKHPHKSRSTAIMLAIFLGGLGIHHFYLERPLRGVLYLLFSWTFVPMILSFFEAVAMLATRSETWDRRWNQTIVHA